jgi:hypothetical protein
LPPRLSGRRLTLLRLLPARLFLLAVPFSKTDASRSPLALSAATRLSPVSCPLRAPAFSRHLWRPRVGAGFAFLLFCHQPVNGPHSQGPSPSRSAARKPPGRRGAAFTGRSPRCQASCSTEFGACSVARFLKASQPVSAGARERLRSSSRRGGEIVGGARMTVPMEVGG